MPPPHTPRNGRASIQGPGPSGPGAGHAKPENGPTAPARRNLYASVVTSLLPEAGAERAHQRALHDRIERRVIVVSIVSIAITAIIAIIAIERAHRVHGPPHLVVVG